MYPRFTQHRSFIIWLGLIVFFALMLIDPSFASSTSGGGLPWESPLQKVRDSLTGPVAFAVSLLGIVAAGIGLVWGGEISDFIRGMIMLVLVISVILLATQIMTTVFGVGAMI